MAAAKNKERAGDQDEYCLHEYGGDERSHQIYNAGLFAGTRKARHGMRRVTLARESRTLLGCYTELWSRLQINHDKHIGLGWLVPRKDLGQNGYG